MWFSGGKWLFLLVTLSLTALPFSSACSSFLATQQAAPDLQQNDFAPLPVTGTASDLAEQGWRFYSETCLDCHGPAGEGGEGPAVIGPSSFVAAYGTALELYYFNAAAMPMTPPRCLSDEQYLQVTVFMLLQNGFISSDTPIDVETLAGTILSRQS